MESGRSGAACRGAASASVPDAYQDGLAALCLVCARLASRIVHRENAGFVGRTRELLIAETLFGPDAPGSVLLVHGPGGIGKSVLLREIRRRGRAAGWTPFEVDARDLAPVPDALEEALRGAWDCERPLSCSTPTSA